MIDRLFQCHVAYVVAVCVHSSGIACVVYFVGGSYASRDLQEKMTAHVYLHIFILCMYLHICIHMGI